MKQEMQVMAKECLDKQMQQFNQKSADNDNQQAQKLLSQKIDELELMAERLATLQLSGAEFQTKLIKAED